MLHDMMQMVSVAERRMKMIGDLEVTLTAADKEALIAAQKEGLDASAVNTAAIPDKCAHCQIAHQPAHEVASPLPLE